MLLFFSLFLCDYIIFHHLSPLRSCIPSVTGMTDPQSLYVQIEQCCFNKSWPIKKQAVLILCTLCKSVWHVAAQLLSWNMSLTCWQTYHWFSFSISASCTSSQLHMVAANIFTLKLLKLTFPLSLSPSLCLCYTCLYLFVCMSFFSTCKENKGIYSAMRLDKVFNISSYLNTTVVSKLKSQ